MENNFLWVRIDNRLVHGQVIETWVPYCRARILVVANDELKNDELRQEIIKLAIPSSLRVIFCEIRSVREEIKKLLTGGDPPSSIFILFASCQDAKAAYASGLSFPILNIGNLHYSPGKLQICDHIFLSSEDIDCIRFFREEGISIDFRCVPNKQIIIKEEGLWE